MNILPKKRWHVRTRENIARVRRDEAKAKEGETAKEERVKLAHFLRKLDPPLRKPLAIKGFKGVFSSIQEKEARRQLLLQKSRGEFQTTSFVPLDSSEKPCQSGHVNFFEDLEEGRAELKQTNKEREKEVKDEKEKYEKQIGYLTYLGQDTNEALGKKSWYEQPPNRAQDIKEVSLKSKLREDPLVLMKKIGEQHKKARAAVVEARRYSELRKEFFEDVSRQSKKRKIPEDIVSPCAEKEAEKQRKLEALRAERLRREKEERRRSDELLAKVIGGEEKKQPPKETKRRYNAQFNPELAKQNYSRR
ncbi:hypothetical protein HUJ04_008982 [Dendroctonus ponderosae]|nr:hypothetical protein HUJ04_008982 [Dendroctonus ponderosae]